MEFDKKKFFVKKKCPQNKFLKKKLRQQKIPWKQKQKKKIPVNINYLKKTFQGKKKNTYTEKS